MKKIIRNSVLIPATMATVLVPPSAAAVASPLFPGNTYDAYPKVTCTGDQCVLDALVCYAPEGHLFGNCKAYSAMGRPSTPSHGTWRAGGALEIEPRVNFDNIDLTDEYIIKVQGLNMRQELRISSPSKKMAHGSHDMKKSPGELEITFRNGNWKTMTFFPDR